MVDTREDRIRHRAHALWEAAGQPEGAHDTHWQQAETEIDMLDTPPAADAAPAAPKPAPRKPRARATPKPAAKPRASKKG